VTGTPPAEPGAPVATPLVRAKLRPPEVVPHYVRRPRLISLLDEAVAAPLTLVAAPAGAGKTSLLVGWTAESTLPAAWLSLDEGDRDAGQLWRSMSAALDTLAPGCSDRARAAVRGRSSVIDAVGLVLDDLDERPNPVSAFVVDDVHIVDADPLVVESLALFLQHLPPWLRVVALSRRDLPLPLDRLRARGQLAEIRFPALRFTRDEASDLLSQLAPSLAEDQIDAAAERADGWAASLHLAALAARSARASNEVFAPSVDDDALVHDYVVHEVLAAEAPELIEALSDVAVVERVSPSLARALAGRPDAGDLLRRAEARGLFVTRLPASGSFEVHSLVRAALVAESAARSPDRLTERHVRAARWYEDAGETVQALEHWLLGGLPREALRLLAATHAELYDSGREGAVLRTIAAVPPEVANADLTTMLDYAWCHVLVDRRRFLELVDKLAWWADQAGAEAAIRPRVTMLQSIGATVSGRWRDGGALARQAMANMGERWWRDPLGRFGWNMVARDVALSERWDDTSDDVRQAELALSRDPERRLAFEGTRALGEALAGRPVDALRVAAGVRRAAAVTNMTMLRADLAVAEAIARREIGDRSRALVELEALAETPAGTMLSCQVLALSELVQAYVDEGDLDAARQVLGRAQALVERESFGPDGRVLLARAGTVVALADGAVGQARSWSDQIDDGFWADVCAARVELTEGNRPAAAAALEAAVPRCGRHEVVRALVRAKVAEDRSESIRHVTGAVERAAALGLLQTVASEGAEVAQLVERAAWRAPPEWIDRLRRAAVPSSRALSPAEDPVASLTGRERDVLRLLAGRLTVREIAGELYVSPNTLKFHLKTIYRKLGVGSRAEAADIARRATLVPPR
jgi:LuxR family transcriptional regulator, maltose regulon positive regulatory protein